MEKAEIGKIILPSVLVNTPVDVDATYDFAKVLSKKLRFLATTEFSFIRKSVNENRITRLQNLTTILEQNQCNGNGYSYADQKKWILKLL